MSRARTILIALLLAGTVGTLYGQEGKINLLVFSNTNGNGYRHKAIPNAIKSFVEMGYENNWELTFTEDSTLFKDDFLSQFDVVVFLLTSKNVLDENQQKAFERFIRSGGGFVGIHSSAATEYDWPWYRELIGAYFVGHPPVHSGKLIIEDRDHLATSHFETDTLSWTDEYYSFDKNPRSNVHVLISIEEDSYNIDDNRWFKQQNLAMDGDHPLVWYREFDGGRSFYTALGHVPESYDDPLFRKHLIGAVKWAAGE